MVWRQQDLQNNAGELHNKQTNCMETKASWILLSILYLRWKTWFDKKFVSITVLLLFLTRRRNELKIEEVLEGTKFYRRRNCSVFLREIINSLSFGVLHLLHISKCFISDCIATIWAGICAIIALVYLYTCAQF